MPGFKVAIYARVSTKDQNAECQLHDLRRYCQARAWDIAGEFVDLGFSGAKNDRPALSHLMDFMRKRKADSVLVWRLDRFGRSLRHLLNTLLELTEIGANFVSYSEGLDTTTAHGRLQLSILGAFAEFERELARERIYSGLRLAKERGSRFGRPLAKYDRDKAFQLRTQGLSLREIGVQTGASIGTLCTLFKNHVSKYPAISDGEEIRN
jgi:putative DNA-invertase from lambdoid prophage Rac